MVNGIPLPTSILTVIHPFMKKPRFPSFLYWVSIRVGGHFPQIRVQTIFPLWEMGAMPVLGFGLCCHKLYLPGLEETFRALLKGPDVLSGLKDIKDRFI